jgi:hypothetical protein
VTDGGTPPADPDWERRRRLAEVFGDVLPDTTSDEREPDPGESKSSGSDDKAEAWLREQVPPHHGATG